MRPWSLSGPEGLEGGLRGLMRDWGAGLAVDPRPRTLYLGVEDPRQQRQLCQSPILRGGQPSLPEAWGLLSGNQGSGSAALLGLVPDVIQGRV